MTNFVVDFERNKRMGFPEVVYAANKPVDMLKNIIRSMLERDERVLVTRLQPEKYNKLNETFETCFYDEASSLAVIGLFPEISAPPVVGILSGGSSDEPAVNEAFYTLQFMGIPAVRIQDVGVAGIHRLFKHETTIRDLEILIVAAGFEGALPSVIGGLFPQPIIAVPTSVGYGVASGGRAALDAMLASCANGLTVVNIDNGFGAAMAALRISGRPRPNDETVNK